MKKNLMTLLLASCFLAACSPTPSQSTNNPAPAAVIPQESADWVANNPHIYFLSSKINQQKNSVTEQSEFAQSTARLDKQGQFQMDIDLNSVKTNIEIRDQRLKEWVFETATFPKANISGQLDAAKINQLAIGETLRQTQNLTLDIHGQKLNLTADLLIQRESADSISVSTINPVIVDVKDMDMVKGVAQLVEVMGLSSIVEQVPVSFKGSFQRQP